MSRSIHKTVKGVFGGKSVKEMNTMIEENDPDVEDLGKKYAYKKEEKSKRKGSRQEEKIEKGV